MVVTQGSNVYCYTGLNMTNGAVEERGCVEDKLISEVNKNLFILPCEGDNCNSAGILKELSCVKYNGFKTKYHRLAKKMRCNEDQQTMVPGCYTIFLGKKVEMACNSQFPIDRFMQLYSEVNTAQFCFTGSNCNGIKPNFCVNYDKTVAGDDNMEYCKEFDTRCYVKPGE